MKKIYILFLALFCSASGFSQLIINEVLYDPSNNELDGDANGDGVYDQEEDSFIEFLNTGATNFDASGYQIWDDESTGAPRFVIPEGTLIPPLGALVVFGGGTPTGPFGGALVLTVNNPPEHMNLNNSGEIILIKDPEGVTVLTFDSDALSNNPNESYTRNPDFTGEFEQHNDNTPLLFSPGTLIDGNPFNTGLVVSEITVEGEDGISVIDVDNGTLQMIANVFPENAANTEVTWSVPDGNGVATIDANGLLSAINNGVVTVTATSTDGTNISGSTEITVSNQVNVILVSSITVAGESGATTIDVPGGTLQMIATVLPADATDPGVTWSITSGESAASIDASGLLTAIENGVVTVTATSIDGSNVSGSAEITISNQTSSVNDNALAAQISVYPNPTTDFIVLKSDLRIAVVEVYTATGQLVKAAPYNGSRIDMTGLDNALYIIRVQTEGEWVSFPVVKQ
jgi:hypothetical protein